MKKRLYSIVFATQVLMLMIYSPPVFSQFEVSGLITNDSAVGIPNARVTLFNSDESIFFEARTNDVGFYNFSSVPAEGYTIGATALNKEYAILSMNVEEDKEGINFSLEEEIEIGNWEIIMESPEPLGGSDFGVLLPNRKIFYCHNSKAPFLFEPSVNDTAFVQGDTLIQGCVAPGLLLDGKIIFVGGADQEVYGPGTQLVKTFDPVTQNWESQNSILDYRWYPTMIQMPDCKLLVIGGGGLDNPVRVKTTEVYDPTDNTTLQVDDVEIGNEVSPIVFLYTGEALMTHRPPQLFTPSSGQWELAADFVQGNRTPNGDHADHELVLLPDGRAVAIGYKSFNPPDYGNIVEIYDPQIDQWSLGENFLPVRSRAKTVLLPDKKILVMGGEKEDPNDSTYTNQWNYTKLTDLYDPYSNNWRRLQDLNIAREYHCNTILVPDGRIIAVGGEGAPGNEPGLSTIEAFEPPYLFKGVRPEIHNLNKQEFLRGETIEFNLKKTNTPTAILLLSLQSVTHSMNTGNNRFLELDFIQSGNNVINAIIPTDSIAAMAGYYMLFAMVDDIPSVAEIIKIEKGQIITSNTNLEVQNSIKVYPNPTLNEIRLSGLFSSVIELYNTSGQLLEKRESAGNDEHFNLANFPSGVYYLNIKTSERNHIYKVVKH